MLEFRDVSFSYGKKKIFDRFSMELKSGEILALMGPSGKGKTTLLSLAAGILRPQSGFVISDVERISYAFQEPRLFPWCTVKENLAAPLPRNGERDAQIREVLSFVGLSDAASLYPDELSGGMKSRVSLARAMLFGGELYLLDEPFAALDEETRIELCEILKEHLHKAHASAIFVTHQRSDAERLADRILEI